MSLLPSPPSRRQMGRLAREPSAGLVLAVAVCALVLAHPLRAWSPPGLWSGTVPWGLGFVALGLAGNPDDVDRLVTEVRRARSEGREADFSTARDDEVGDLYDAVGDLADDLAACRREREGLRDRASEAERRLDRYRPLVESAGDPMAILDAEGRFEELNDAMAQFHGRDRDDLVGSDARELVAGRGVDAIEAAQRRLLTERDRRWEQVEVTLTDAEGAERRFEANLGVLRDEDGAFDGSVLTFRDVTERVETEATLREREQSLATTSDRLESANDALQALHRIGASTDLDLEAKVQRILDLGRDHLGTDGAFLSAIDADEGRFEFVQTSGTGDGLRPGTVAPFSETYCRKTVEADGVVAVGHASEEGWAGDPAYERWGFETYVGRTVSVEGELHGTLGFVDADGGGGRLTDDQRLVVDLAAQWLGYELERRRRERRLEEFRSYTNDVLDAIDDVFYVLDEAGNLRRWNRSLSSTTGYEDGEIEGMNALDFFAESDRDTIADAIETVIETVIETGSVRVEASFLTKGGETIPFEFVASRVETPRGEPVLAGIGRNVAKRKARERELRATNERLNALVEASPDALIALDEVGEVTLWNPAAEDIFGWAEAEVLGEEPPFVPEDMVDEYRGFRERVLAGERLTGIETGRVRKDGELVDVSLSVAPLREDGEVVGSMAILEDISDRKTYQRELERTTELLARAEEMAAVGGWSVEVTDGEPHDPVWTDKLYDTFELPMDADLPTTDVVEFYHPDDRDRHRAAVDEAVATGERWDQELRLVTAEGTERWVRNIGEPVVEDGEVVRISGSIQDITESKVRERALRDRERRLEEYREYTDDILDAIDDVFYVIDDEGNFLRWNESAETVTGYTSAEIAETDAFEFFPESVHGRIVEAMSDVFGASGSRRVEAPLLTRDGEEIPYEFIATTVENPDGREVLVGIGRDVTDRERREAALERTTELLEQAQRIATVGGWEYDVRSGGMTVTDEFRRIHGIGADDAVTLEAVVESYHPEDREYVQETFEAAVETGEGYDMEVRLGGGDRGTRWVRALAEPILADGETVALRGSVQDVTDARERERAIRALHDAAQGLLHTETASEVADLVVETGADVLDVSGVCLYLLDAAQNSLVPEACTAGFEAMTDGAPPIAVGDEDDPVWNSFATGSRRVFDDGEEAGFGGLFAEDVGGGLVVPIGDHGVLVVTTAQPGVPVRTRQLVETLVATTEAAFDRLESEASLRERDAELEARNRRLSRQIQLTDVIRRVDRSLVGANSQSEIERAVCEELSDADDVAFAWIGSLDVADERVEPRTWAGDGEAYLDAVDLGAETAEPAARTARSGEPTVVSNVIADVTGEAWRKPALDAGAGSALAVPIAFEDYRHGVLAVYADDPDAIGDLERTVFAELGQTIANAINAVQTREALHADALLELTLDVEAPDTFLAQLARRADCDVEYVGIGSQSAERASVFFATGAETGVEGALSAMVSVQESRLLSEREGRRVFEATVTGPVLPAKLLRHGAQPGTIEASPDGVRVVVSVPTSTDVREFVEMLGESHQTVELVGRRTVTRETRTRQEMVGDLLEELTERQLEVLRTAYYAGYFDWPRGSSGEEIAELLGVTQPTFSRHLRLGQRQLLGELLAEEPTTLTAS